MATELSECSRIVVTMQDAPSDADLIAFTGERFKYAGARERQIWELFDLSATRYWQQVNAIVNDADRVAALPPELGPVVNRIRRLHAQRAGQRRPSVAV